VTRRTLLLSLLVGSAVVVFVACSGDGSGIPHGAIADDISGPLGEPVPFATPEQLADFEDGREVALRRFGLQDGLGPAFNVTFCGACHERPVTGGSAGLYRNFFIAGTTLSDGSFVNAESQGDAGGVVRMYSFDPDEFDRPEVPEEVNLSAQRNPIPFFGVGLLAEISDSEILERADPDDSDGDGISGRPNYDRGFVGRFGRKAQTVSIEGFIRGPLFNHLGITSNPLTEDEKAALPVDSSSDTIDAEALAAIEAFAQAAAPDGPLTDADGVADPELSGDDLFDLVSYAMLLAAPQFETPSEQSLRGAEVFDSIGCGSCHTPRLDGPRGPIPVYSDLLLHDMGPDLADGIEMGDASGSEFRTQPLWGLSAVGPYLHDGRAATIESAILMHGGEGGPAAKRAGDLDTAEMADLVEFLESLGGRSQFTTGLLAPNTPIPGVGAYGGPSRQLTEDEASRFEAGRELFDHEFGFADGAGAPLFNGDSCRACHFDPVIGGSGPSGVNVMRHGSVDAAGAFVAPDGGTILHKQTARLSEVITAPHGTSVFEQRQTPTLLGLGLVDGIAESTIAANADPDDLDNDGISGRVAQLDDERIGRFGWKAQVPSLAEFIRDAAAAELGMTTAPHDQLTFGITADSDGVSDPELSLDDTDLIEFFLATLAPPPRSANVDSAEVTRGAEVFNEIGCASCHIPTLDGVDGPVPLYSDLLLHEVLPIPEGGIPDGPAAANEFRTPPLWGLRDTAPYLHDGRADTISDAVSAHAGEATASIAAYSALEPAELAALQAFLESL
jgi:CxxC motif-containing protein (DUF1111 family)